ncbi:hypothetical protein CRE_03305 [Caenorhabditis remanei]|uniref:Uncharacterized protein n=1 Tax=Caenorhabditis remanei TaxID=31234 RepID=E3MMJ7_CAERE|nr:hypothetical protein CRE_03305 [Caenorhabditis remanei]
MNTSKSRFDKKPVLNEAILDVDLPPISQIPLPEISKARENELLDDPKEASPEPSVFGIGAERAAEGKALEQEELDYAESSGHESDIGDDTSKFAGNSPSKEETIPPNQQVIQGPLNFFVYPDGIPESPIPLFQESKNNDQGPRPVSEFVENGEEEMTEIEIRTNEALLNLEKIPSIDDKLKNILELVQTLVDTSVTPDQLNNFVTKKDLEKLALKSDLDTLVKKADILDRLPTLDVWTNMIENLAPFAALQGLSSNMNNFLVQLTSIAEDQRRISKRQGQGNGLVQKLIDQGKFDREDFEKTSLKITRVYNSLRDYIARKVSALEQANEVRSLKTLVADIREKQASYKQILDLEDPAEEHRSQALGEIYALERSSELAQIQKNTEHMERKLLENRRLNSVKCFFCHQNHDAAKCHVYPDLPSRRQQLLDEHRCLICGKSGCDGSEETCKAANRECRSCSASLPIEERQHHQTLCPRRYQKRNSSAVFTASKNDVVATSIAPGVDEDSSSNMAKYLDNSRPQIPGRFRVKPEHVIHGSGDSDEEDEPSLKRPALVATSSNGNRDEPKAKKQKHTRGPRGGKKFKFAKKGSKIEKSSSAPVVKSEPSIKEEHGNAKN